METTDIFSNFPDDNNVKVKPRPYINHSVDFKGVFSAKERIEMLKKVGLNVFFFPAERITGVDFLSDSGTTTMTADQWAALHQGDESYGSNRGFFILMETIKDLFGDGFFNSPEIGKPNAFLFHQGRPCEDALFSMLGKTGENLCIPSNGHFDTTHANIENNGIEAINLFCKEFRDKESDSHFKGNMDIERLKEILESKKGKIPVVSITITNNTGGGQPVSMANIKETSELVHSHDLPLLFDACRFAENAWFIKNFEDGFKEKSIKEIIKEMFSYVDGFTTSFKKDGLVNIGGGIFLKDGGKFIEKFPEIPDALLNFQIIKEGHPTYGGLAGRDLMALVVGLKTIVKENYLDHRINQVKDFGEALKAKGIPVLTPFGGHAVYLDVNKFFEGTEMEGKDFGGIAFTALLLGLFGHRACELGYFAFGKYENGEEIHPEVNFVRFAIPRLRYEKQDLDSAAEAVKLLYDNRDKIPKIEVIYGRDLPLRHFKAKFRFNSSPS